MTIPPQAADPFRVTVGEPERINRQIFTTESAADALVFEVVVVESDDFSWMPAALSLFGVGSPTTLLSAAGGTSDPLTQAFNPEDDLRLIIMNWGVERGLNRSKT